MKDVGNIVKALKEGAMIDSYAKGENWSIYHCDNRDLLNAINHESIDMIYCDILYGTGRNFGAYQDIKADRQVVRDEYFDKFVAMRDCLKETGSIYIHCDWRISHWIRLMLDEIFGYNNLISRMDFDEYLVRKHPNDKERNQKHIEYYMSA